MTRFARSKGSKASNERREEEATPWHVMRQQLVNHMSNDKSQSNLDSCELRSLCKIVSETNKKDVWCEFEETSNINIEKPKGKTSKGKNKMKNQSKSKKNSSKEKETSLNTLCCSKTNNKTIHVRSKGMEKPTSNQKSKETINNKYKPAKTNSSVIPKHVDKCFNDLEKQLCDSATTSSSNTLKSSSEFEVFPDMHKSKQLKNKSIANKSDNDSKSSYLDHQHKLKPNKYDNQYSNGVIIANGREIEVVEFEGFLIKKDDAKELKKLRKKLRNQKIPNEKIKAVIKLERRKAEKSLVRERKKVCYQCRKFGHNFSDCPDIMNTNLCKSGMCFKCGSMEHSHFQCKVLRNQEFRFAICFVCKEEGHIARQCSLNSQGQYPKGGCCHLCGEVTHLKKDCPKAISEKPSKTSTVEQLKSDELEDINDVTTNVKHPTKKKMIVF